MVDAAPAPAAVAQIPSLCRDLRRQVERTVDERWQRRYTHLVAAQMQQESACRPTAVSPVGAQGLMQIMPATAQDIASRVARDLGGPRPLDPTWSLRAGVSYQRHQYLAIRGAVDECEQYAFALSAYNGGLGWINGRGRGRSDRELAAHQGADPDRWWGHVEHWSQRSAAAFRENRGYVRRIVADLQVRYLSAGYPGLPLCV